jgi:N6-adenosine-specific RNA methylase IME4
MRKYKTIYVDPPWSYGKWGKNSGRGSRGDFSGRKDVEYNLPYKSMTIAEIQMLPIYTLADKNCELYTWTTQKYLPFIFDVIRSWSKDFSYCQMLTWCKAPRGLGQGGVYCPTTEFLVLARKGLMPTGISRIDSTWWNIKRPHNSHSTKPDFFRQLIENVTLAPRIELFAREKVRDWDVWGNEVESDIEL